MFSIAWGVALRKALEGSTERGRWRDALRHTMRVWEAAYSREGESALASFADRAIGSGARLCKRSSCPRALPPGSRGYCSAECAREGEREARLAA